LAALLALRPELVPASAGSAGQELVREKFGALARLAEGLIAVPEAALARLALRRVVVEQPRSESGPQLALGPHLEWGQWRAALPTAKLVWSRAPF